MRRDPRRISARMLDLNFNMLVDFVELDCAEQRRIYSRQKRPLVNRLLFWRERQSPEDGLAHIDSLIRSGGQQYCSAPSEQDFGEAYLFQETMIADDGAYVSVAAAAWSHAAREMKELYFWYTTRRRTGNRREANEAEDQAMLIRLMKIRLYLWM
jgi:hypothetical protein